MKLKTQCAGKLGTDGKKENDDRKTEKAVIKREKLGQFQHLAIF
jgi:hypothetical protein